MFADKIVVLILLFMRLAAASCVLAAAVLLMLIGDDMFSLLLAKFMFIFLPAIIWYAFTRVQATTIRLRREMPLILVKAVA